MLQLQMYSQKKWEFMEFLSGAIPRDEYKLEFLILKGQIGRSLDQQIESERTRSWQVR